jgi:hypothetical protein
MMKSFYLLMCVVLSFDSYATPDADVVVQETNQAGSVVCEQTIRAYPRLRDHGPINEYGALFSQDAVLEIKKLGISLQGRGQITNRLTTALETTKTHHLVSKVHLEPVPENRYKAQSRFTLNLKKLSEPQSSSITITGQYEDLLQFDGQHCVIVSRQVNIDTQIVVI